MAETYRVRPSVLLNIPDEYTSYCFDEACAYILGRLRNKEKPIFAQAQAMGKNYSRPSELYAQIIKGGC